MDAETARADYERRKVDVGWGAAEDALFEDLLAMIADLQSRVAALEGQLAAREDLSSNQRRRLINLECQVFGYVQS